MCAYLPLLYTMVYCNDLASSRRQWVIFLECFVVFHLCYTALLNCHSTGDIFRCTACESLAEPYALLLPQPAIRSRSEEESKLPRLSSSNELPDAQHPNLRAWNVWANAEGLQISVSHLISLILPSAYTIRFIVMSFSFFVTVRCIK